MTRMLTLGGLLHQVEDQLTSVFKSKPTWEYEKKNMFPM